MPEFIPWYGSNAPVAQRAIEYLRHPEELADLSRKLQHLIRSLDRPGASMNAARLALQLIERRPKSAMPGLFASTPPRQAMGESLE